MAARAFTAVEMHSWQQQGVVMLAKITFAQIADRGHLEGSHSKRGIPYYHHIEYIFLLLWLPMEMVCRTLRCAAPDLKVLVSNFFCHFTSECEGSPNTLHSSSGTQASSTMTHLDAGWLKPKKV